MNTYSVTYVEDTTHAWRSILVQADDVEGAKRECLKQCAANHEPLKYDCIEEYDVDDFCGEDDWPHCENIVHPETEREADFLEGKI